MTDCQQEAEKVIEESKAQIEEEAENVEDNVTFFEKMGIATENVKKFVKSRIGTILATSLSAFSFSDIKDKDKGQVLALLGSGIDKMLDPGKVSGNLQSAEDSDMDYVLKQTSTTDKSTTESMGNIAGSTTAKPRIKDVVIGTFGIAATIGSNAIGDDNRNFQKFSVLTALAFIHEPKSVWAIAQDCSKAFGTKNLLRRGLLVAIKETVEEIYDELLHLDPGWYGLNIKQRVIDAKDELNSADQKLMVVRRKTYQHLFDNSLFKEADEHVELAIEDLSDYSGIALDFGMVEVQLLLVALARLTDKIEKVQADIDKHKLNIEDFAVNLLENSRFDNMAATLIANIQLQIRNIIREMEEAIAGRPRLKLVKKMASWIMRLNVIHALMKNTSKVLDNYLDSDPDGYRSIFDEIGDDLKNIDFYESSASMADLIFHLRRYHSECTQKLSVNTDITHIEWRKNVIVDIINEQLDKSSLVVDALLAVPDVAQSLIQDGGASVVDEGKSIVSDMKGMADDMGFDKVSKAFKTGDWKTIFSSDAETASTTGSINRRLSRSKKCAEEAKDKSIVDKIDLAKDRIEKSHLQKKYNATTMETQQKKATESTKEDILAIKTLHNWVQEIGNYFGVSTS